MNEVGLKHYEMAWFCQNAISTPDIRGVYGPSADHRIYNFPPLRVYN